jgi:hypothetical protein
MGWGLQKMTTEKQATIADGCTPKPIEVVIVRTAETESLYVGGIKAIESTLGIDVDDLTRHAGRNPVVLTIADADHKSSGEMPMRYEDIAPHIYRSVGF